jgi:hypothetical protein
MTPDARREGFFGERCSRPTLTDKKSFTTKQMGLENYLFGTKVRAWPSLVPLPVLPIL